MGNVVSLAEEKKRRRRAGSLGWLWTAVVLIGALSLGFGLAQSPLFHIRSIEVTGIGRITREEVLELAGITPGEHIYEVNLKKAANMIATNRWVEQVEIKRKLPATVVINVKERVPAAAITTGDGLYIVDSGGVLLARQKLLDGLSMLVISGIGALPEDAYLGTQLDDPDLAAALAVIRQMDEQSAAVIAEINVADSQRIIAHTTYGVDFYLGDKSDFAAKFKLAMQILQNETNKGLLESVDYIDVALTDQPVLAYLT